ncbi:ATP-binding cassette domain-containing protein [Ornithinimicrobium ciconiae]|uniref:ABC-type quaternary amine transporter n=1 Tax=Ornithinimicrobium ciconiae TaxID=2594265 RepID=A0A516G799_9MICO|nr:ATP-binding cassette domain-containing protein [Ornithinimicrobium ciconiae]QDO87375.1 ATP-binding cassette domain-containing protein [Ornithinimicrobium ciconiae]
MILLEGVTKQYGDAAPAVDNLTLEARTGEITVLVGPSGCGKTTSLRMINRMIEPTSGRILLDGKDTSQVPAAKLRRDIGYVIQHAGLFPHRTVLHNVMTVPRLNGWGRARAETRAREVLELVGLPGDFAARYPAQLSGGQQQRVGVARALASDPSVILMDEPFSAVDPIAREGLQDDLLRLQSELGTTIVLVTHDIDEAIKLGNRVAVLRQGGVLAQFSTPADLLAHPADDFVADFVGRDRGYRALSFQHADVPLHPEEPVAFGQPLGHREEPWLLAVDADSRPQGWIIPAEVGTGSIGPEHLHRAGTVAAEGGSLRSLLDAALSSPSGRGVVVRDGALVGTVRAQEVLTVIQNGSAPGAGDQHADTADR